MTLFIGCLAAAGLIGYYFLILKPKQDEKGENKRQRESRQDIDPVDESRYKDIINDYPTLFTQDGVK